MLKIHLLSFLSPNFPDWLIVDRDILSKITDKGRQTGDMPRLIYSRLNNKPNPYI